MIHYIEVAPDGQILRACSSGVASLDDVRPFHAGVLVELPEPVDSRTHFWDGAAVQAMGAKPSQHHVFDYRVKQWVDSRPPNHAEEELRASLLRQIAALEAKQMRSVREITLGRGNQTAARAALADLDDQITALRAQLPA